MVATVVAPSHVGHELRHKVGLDQISASKLVDELLGVRGGKRLVERGEGDASAAEFFEVFDEWEKAVWEKLGKVRTRSCFRRVQVARLMVILTFVDYDLIGIRHDCERGGDGPADQEGLWGCRACRDFAPEGHCAWGRRREQGASWGVDWPETCSREGTLSCRHAESVR